jgi:hypothetical protein
MKNPLIADDLAAEVRSLASSNSVLNALGEGSLI